MKAIRTGATPSTLDALVFCDVGGAPEPAAGEITVALKATSLNYHDYAVVTGMIPSQQGRIPMSDGAGVVTAVGDGVTEFSVGDPVVSTFFPDWLDGADAEQGVETYPLPEALVLQLATASSDTAELEAHITGLTGLHSPKEVTIDREFNEVTLDYPLPAGYAFVVVSSEAASMDVEYRRGSLLVLWNDLHKGRHSGAVWGILIDGSAILMVFFALTGLVILLQNPRFRGRGLVVVVLGAVTPWLIYVIAVPSLR